MGASDATPEIQKNVFSLVKIIAKILKIVMNIDIKKNASITSEQNV